jgi:hypothetical protein
MKLYAYLLIFLVMSAQVDDFWAGDPTLPTSAPPVADNDEYLPAQRRPEEEESFCHQRPIFESVMPHLATILPTNVQARWNLTTPFTPPPLYAFMSMQI